MIAQGSYSMFRNIDPNQYATMYRDYWMQSSSTKSLAEFCMIYFLGTENQEETMLDYIEVLKVEVQDEYILGVMEQ